MQIPTRSLSVALLGALILTAGCWEQFEGDPTPAEDDDDFVPVDDDDDAVDDDDATDDDDSGPAEPCTDPALGAVATVSLTDPVGNPTTSFAIGSPLTVSVAIENLGSIPVTQSYGSPCLFTHGVFDANGLAVGGGRICNPALTTHTFTCGDAPVTDSDVVAAEYNLAPNDPLPSGSYTLQVDLSPLLPSQTFPITVP